MRWLKVLAVLVLAVVAVVAARRWLAPKTPARRDPASLAEGPQVATTGEPGQDHPMAPGEERSPRSAAADLAAVGESRGPVAWAGAGDSYARPPLGVLGPAPCSAPTPDGPCGLRLGHPVGPWLPGHDGHLPIGTG